MIIVFYDMQIKTIVNITAILLAMCMHVSSQETADSTWYSILDFDYQLIIASDRGDSLRASELIDWGADVNAKTYDDVTPLMYAAQNGYPAIVKMLIGKGASLDMQSTIGYTALIAAVRSDHIETAELLIRNGADINLADRKKATPLMYAVAMDRFYIADMLLYYGADVSLKDRNGVTAIMIACRKGNYEIALRLIEYGAGLNTTDEQGRSALHFAAISGNADLVDALIKSGADIEKKTASGYSPLAAAVDVNEFEAARMLIGSGADINSRIIGSLNVLSLAEKNKNSRLIEMLRNNGAAENYWPRFNHFITDVEFSFNRDNTDLRFAFGIGESKYNLQVVLGYGFWIKPMQVLEQVDYDVYYQYWERRSSVSLALKKDVFRMRAGKKVKLGIFAGMKGTYSFGNHKGSDTRADNQWALCPAIGIMGECRFVRLSLHYEYMNLNIYKGSNNRINLTVSFLLSRKQGILNTELNNWL